MKLTAPAYIKNGKLKLHDRKGFAAAIQDVESAGAMLELTIYTKDRDYEQMRKYYFAVIVPHVMKGLYDTQGERFSFQQTHDILKYKFFYREMVDPETGEIARLPLSLADGAAKITPDFREKIKQLIEDSIYWAHDFLGVVIPASDRVAVVG